MRFASNPPHRSPPRQPHRPPAKPWSRLTPRPLLRHGLRLGAAVLVGLVAVVYAWRPAQAWLADRAGEIAAARPETSGALYQLLSPLGEEALPAVVRNAASSDPRVADTARRTLDAWLDVWAASSGSEGPLALPQKIERTLALLVEAMPGFTESGGDWARRFARHALAMSDRTAPAHRATVIASVDELLRVINRTRLLPDPIPQPVAATLAGGTADDFEKDATSDFENVIASETPTTAAPRDAETGTARAVDAPPEAAPAVEIAIKPTRVPRPLPTAASDDPSWRPDWRQSPDGAEKTDPAMPRPLRYADMSDRQLLAELVDSADVFRVAQRLQAIGPGAPPAENQPAVDPAVAQRMAELGHALAERGYRGVSLDHAEAMLSSDPRERLALVERLLTGRAGDAARIMLLLARDESAEVRVAAISALGTSPHRQLVEAAWSLALRDEDPRVGRLAEGLRERLR